MIVGGGAGTVTFRTLEEYGGSDIQIHGASKIIGHRLRIRLF
jgi:hypothetical protein